MECRATVSKKLGSSFNGTSIYDGVFSGSAPFRSSSFSSSSSSRPEDYAEIFGGSRDSRRSSIPVLDVPALHERKMSVDVRSSKLEYTKIFGDGSDVGQLSYEDIVVDPRKMRNLSRQEPPRAHARSSSEVSFSSLEDNQVIRNASHPSLDKGKKHFSVSYNKSVAGSKDGISGTTHITQLHDVPGYARLVDEDDPSKQLKGSKPVTNDAQSKYGAEDGSLKAKNAKKSESSLSSSSPDKECSKDVLQNRSRSHSSLFEGYEFGLRTEPSEVQASTGCSPNFSRSKGNSKFAVSPSNNVSQSGVGIGSPTYFDQEVDANSVAAASADAVRKAIEKAQARIKIAKEMMGRGKEAFQANMESKGSWERRREHKRASKLREKDSQEQRLKEYGKLNTTKMGCEITDIGDHVTHSDNVANCTAGHESREDQMYDRQGEAVERDGTKLSGTITESEETEAKTIGSRQGIGINKMEVSDDCDKLITRTAEFTIENAAGNGTILTAVKAIPFEEVHDKTVYKLSADEGAQECDSNSNKLESSIQLQHVERDEMELEVKEEQLDSAKELMGHSDQGEYCGPEEFHKSSSEINLDENQLGEKTVRAEDCGQEENDEKQSESHEAEDYIKSRVISDNESCGWKIDGKQENEEREGESSERECSREEYEENPIEGHEGKDSVGSREVPDSEESITCEKLDAVEEKRERQGESCEREFGAKSEGMNDKQETKEFNGFNFGVDAKQWLDHMKEILHVRINSFLDAKENRRCQESSAVEDTNQIEPEGSEEILVETHGMEATRELHDAQGSMVDDNIRVDVNVRSESKVQDVANEGKVDDPEELTGTMEVSGDEENKESADITGDDSEDEENEELIETTNLSVEEKEVLVSDSNLTEGEASNLSVEEEDNSSGNLEEMCGSETSDLTGASLEADGERQVQDDVEVVGFSENDVKLGFTSIKFGFLQSDRYVEEPEETYEMVKHVEGLDPRKNKFHGEKGAEILSNEEIDAEDMTSQGELDTKVSNADRQTDDELNVKENQLEVVYERKEERIKLKQETTADQTTDSKEEDRTTTKIAKEKETRDCLETVEPERVAFKKRDEREREREKERLAVERAIREARERAFAEARERAERAAVDKATAEARQRVIAQAREKLGKASSETLNKPAEKTSVEARLKVERAAVERATAEARERALEKAMSEKLSGARKDNKVRQKSSYDAQHKSSGNSSNHRSSNSSDNGVREVPRSSDRSNGANTESAQRSKARLERHQRTAERAAKALAEKNMRDLLAQREQAERNRLAEALDADVKRWSSGKQGNLRALLSTLQYILGPDSGWQSVTLTEIVTAAAVKKAYRKATLCVHPDKLQQRGASLQQKYICEKVFDLLKEAWNRFSAEEK